MRILSTVDFQKEAELALKQIFINDDPYNMPFSLDIEDRMILFEYQYQMNSLLFDAVNRAASEYGEDGFYVSVLGYSRATDENGPYHWFFTYSDMNVYQSIIGPVATMVYSPNGLWGIIGSYEWHGLLGGSTSFVKAVKKQIPDIDKQVLAFLEHWRNYALDYGSDIEWIPQLLTHVYGAEKAAILLQSHPLRE